MKTNVLVRLLVALSLVSTLGLMLGGCSDTPKEEATPAAAADPNAPKPMAAPMSQPGGAPPAPGQAGAGGQAVPATN